jgi:hypothetical protein
VFVPLAAPFPAPNYNPAMASRLSFLRYLPGKFRRVSLAQVLLCRGFIVGIDLLFKGCSCVMFAWHADSLPPPREDGAANSSILGGNNTSLSGEHPMDKQPTVADYIETSAATAPTPTRPT